MDKTAKTEAGGAGGGRAAIRAALEVPYDEAALSRAVLTRLAEPAPPPRLWAWLGPPLALAGYAGLALAFGIGGYQAGGVLDASGDMALGLAFGSLSGVLQ